MAFSASTLTYERDIRPILKTSCFRCHGEAGEMKGNLDLRLRRLILQGGKSGPEIVPGHAQDSRLYELVSTGKMPKSGKPLSEKEVATIEQWIAQGAVTARAEPLTPEHVFTEEERSWWAIQPIKRPPVPRVSKGVDNPIDAFLLGKLAEKNLGFSPAADRVTLIRRATFDLTGLPPTPGEIDDFVANQSPLAYERLIDRLLASPRYGEAWARHWLDVAGYADSYGYSEADPWRGWSFRFRDYVIRAFNADKPFDQFIREQLAGDEMINYPVTKPAPEQEDLLAATGLLRMAPDGTSVVNDLAARNAVIADTVKIVSTALMGVTMGCAQCHDHRFDPITQEDYYRMRAIFEPAYDTTYWRGPQARLVSILGEADRAKTDDIEKQAKALDATRQKKLDAYMAEALEKELAKLPEAEREPARIAYQTPVAKRTPAQSQLLGQHFKIRDLAQNFLFLYNKPAADEMNKLAKDIAALRATKPVDQFIDAMTELPGRLPKTYLFHRGNIDEPKEVIKPGEPAILASWRPADLPAKDPALPTSGRRLAFAKSLTDGRHPLTARVIVNRAWMQHFGRGIVGTPGDFGAFGDAPTHPELLDWLADEFVRQGWSMKKLHKLMLTSTAYRQASKRDPAKERLDADNHLLWRMNVRRLEAETLRDTMLAVSGKLNEKLYGKPVPTAQDETGQVIVGAEMMDAANRPTGKMIPLYGEEFRRSIYVAVRRTQPLGMLETFDAPGMEPDCAVRNVSTVAPQALSLMNGAFALEQARSMAQRVARESGPAPEAQVARAWRLAFGRSPSAADVHDAIAFLAAQTERLRANLAQAKLVNGKPIVPVQDLPELALAEFCQALMNANPFLYVD